MPVRNPFFYLIGIICSGDWRNARVDCASILEMKSPVWTTLYTAASPKSQIYQHFSANNHTPVNPSGISGIFNKGILPLHCKEVSQSLYLQHAEDPNSVSPSLRRTPRCG